MRDMNGDINRVIELHNQGVDVGDIAAGLGLGLGYVKSILGGGEDITSGEQKELKEILLDLARGNVLNTSPDVMLGAAKYLHGTYREDRLNKYSGRDALVVKDLNQKASEKMKLIEQAA